MKKKSMIYGAGALVLSVLGIACDDYLEEDSGDLLIPKKVEEFSPMLYAEGYPSDFNDEAAWFKLMTDDVEMSQLECDPSNSDAYSPDLFDVMRGGEGQQAYIWHQDIGEKLSDNFWAGRYSNILGCNTVIDALPEMDAEGDTAAYNYLAAQAYALRAYHYWCLVNTYALPWSEANLDRPGVVLRTEPQIDVSPRTRSTIRRTYELINADIRLAERYIENSYAPGNKHLLMAPAVYLLASRIALFQEDWDEVIRTAELFRGDGAFYVFDLTTSDTTQFGVSSSRESFHIMNGRINEEIVFTFGNSSTNYDYLSGATSTWLYGLGFRPSRSGGASLLESYEEGDLRRQAWFVKDEPGRAAQYWWEDDVPTRYYSDYPNKYYSPDGSAEKPNDKTYHENWRSVEVLLNLAEAYARKANGVSSDAVGLLNDLRSKRFESGAYAPKTTADFRSAEELVQFIWAERRRELCFEEAMRFWDLRRQGMPRIEHRWYSSAEGYETYVLEEGSPNYVLAIPDSETDYNDACVNNARVIISAR